MPKRYGQSCPVAKTLELIGDRWTLLIVRDLLPGTRRFQDLLSSLSGIAPNILSDRLKLMEEHALVSRRLYSEHPPRAEYELTSKGKELGVIVGALAAWGSRHVVQAVEPGARGLRASREARLLLPGLRRARARRRGAARARAPHREGRVGLIPGGARRSARRPGRVPLDRIIVAAARAGGMPVVTGDSRLRRSPLVDTVW